MSTILTNIASPAVEQIRQQAKTFTLLLGLTALLLSLGFLFGDASNNSNYIILLELFDQHVWALIFAVYGTLKIFQLLEKLAHPLRITTSVVGTWLWIYAFLSFIVCDKLTFSPAELLIVLPLACEAGELVLDIFNFRLCSPSERNPSV